jgi:hypothetical protein
VIELECLQLPAHVFILVGSEFEWRLVRRNKIYKTKQKKENPFGLL